MNNALLYHEIYGSGRPLLLIAGLGSDSSSWSGVVKELSAHFKTVVFDNRGSGRSGLMHGERTIGKMAQDVIKLMDYLKIKKANMLGHSMGGYIAQELAINYPDRVDKLVLGSTAPVSSRRNNILFKKIYDQLKREGPSRGWFKNWIAWLFSPRLIADSSFIDMFINSSLEYLYLPKAKGFKSQIEAIALFDARDKINTIKAKTLILEGKYDVLITPREAVRLAKGIPKSRFKLLSGVAHCMHIENPKLFISTVLGFLKNR